MPHVCRCHLCLSAIQHGSRLFHSRLSKPRSGKQNVQGARQFISASGSQKPVYGVAAVSTVASWSGDSVDPETASVLMSRSPEWLGLEPFHADVAITFAFDGRPSVFGLTAPLDQVSPTWRIKLMLRQRVGPTRARQVRFHSSIVTTDVVKRICWSVRSM